MFLESEECRTHFDASLVRGARRISRVKLPQPITTRGVESVNAFCDPVIWTKDRNIHMQSEPNAVTEQHRSFMSYKQITGASATFDLSRSATSRFTDCHRVRID